MAEMQVYHGPAVMTPVSSVTLTNIVELGERLIHKGEEYVYCYNAGGATITQEYGVKLITGASGFSVAMTSLTDTLQPCVGVAKNVSIATDSYGWIMTKGFCNVHTANSVITGDYKAIGLAAAGAFGELRAPAQIATNVGAGFAISANTVSAGSMYAFISTGF